MRLMTCRNATLASSDEGLRRTPFKNKTRRIRDFWMGDSPYNQSLLRGGLDTLEGPYSTTSHPTHPHLLPRRLINTSSHHHPVSAPHIPSSPCLSTPSPHDPVLLSRNTTPSHLAQSTNRMMPRRGHAFTFGGIYSDIFNEPGALSGFCPDEILKHSTFGGTYSDLFNWLGVCLSEPPYVRFFRWFSCRTTISTSFFWHGLI